MDRHTREFTWANKQNIGKLDLREYTREIDDAVINTIPNEYDPYVDVAQDDFIINTVKKLPNALSRKLGKEIGKTPDIGNLHKAYNYKDGGHSNQIFKGKDIT